MYHRPCDTRVKIQTHLTNCRRGQYEGTERGGVEGATDRVQSAHGSIFLLHLCETPILTISESDGRISQGLFATMEPEKRADGATACPATVPSAIGRN